MADYLCSLLGCRRERRWSETVDMEVMMDCDGCEQKVRRALYSIKGVETVETDRALQKVTVTGYVEPERVMRAARRAGRRARPWPYVPYSWLATAGTAPPATWDRDIPPGHVKNPIITNQEMSKEQQLISMFSDENPNACSVM